MKDLPTHPSDEARGVKVEGKGKVDFGHHARRASSFGSGLPGALAVSVLAAGAATAEGGAVPQGFAVLGADHGVTSARVLPDGRLEVTLQDGAVRLYAADQFRMLEGGQVAVSEAVAEELLALLDAAPGLGALGAGAAAGPLGAAAVATGSGDDADPAVAAVIGGDTSGGVIEDAADPLPVSGVLTVSDPNESEAVFVAQASTAGTYGTFTLDASGNWTYAADNAQAAIQALGADEELTDSFTAATADGTGQVVTVTITGVNDTAVITGTTTGAVTEDADLTAGDLTASGVLSVSDADAGEAEFVAQTSAPGTYGTFTLDASGNWTYAADNAQSAIQALGSGEELTDSFTAATADGTGQVVTVTITGVNDTAVITGTTTGAVTEDADLSDGDLTASGTLSVSDADAGEAVFVAQASTAGTYGTFTLDASGSWTYAADNAQAAIQALGSGEELTDSFTAATADGTGQVVTVTITGVNDGAVIGGTTSGVVTEDAALTAGDLTASGTLSVSDADAGEAVFVAQASTAGTYGTFTLDASGNWTYAADNAQAAIQALGSGEELTDSFTAVTADGTGQVVTVTITGVNDTAVIGGTTSGAVTEDAALSDGDLTASGALSVSDADAGEAEFEAQTSAAGTYGTFTLDASGNWIYAADNSQTAIQALGAGEELKDSFTAVSADGTTETVTVTITGVNDTAVIGGTTSGVVTEDAALSDGDLTASGALSVSDADAGEAEFEAQTSAAGTYGTFTLDASGNWIYAADNSQTAIQALGAGEELKDSFTAVSADGTTETVTVTITGVNDGAVIGGTTSGVVTEDAALTAGDLTASGTLSVSDADAGEAEFEAQTSAAVTYGTFTLDASGNWTYAADNSQTAIQALGAGEELEDSFTAATADGTGQVVTVTITGVNDTAVITGTTTGAVTEDADLSDGDLTASGTLSVSDADAGEAVFVAQASTAGTYGTFTLDASGNWTYAADNAQAAIQALGSGEELTDSFTAATADGTGQVVTVTITGVNDTAVITGTTTGAVTEDADLSDGDLTASGTLSVSDADAGEAVFVAQASTAGTYGTFTLDASGNWTYAADNAQAAIQALGSGEELTDSFTAATADGTGQVVTVTITGVNDTAVITGTTTGAVTEDADLTAGDLTASGVLSVSDADAGEAEFVAQTSAPGTYGTFTLDASGNWTYAADNAQSAIQALGSGEELTDSFTAATADGTGQVVTVTITGVNDTAVITGTTTGAVTEDADLSDGDLTASGTLSVSDADAGEAVFVAQASTAGTYGTFTLDASGNWTYAADNAQAAIQALGSGEELTDSFTAATADGTGQVVTVTITGVNDGAVIGGTTSGVVTEDAALTAGDLTASGTLSVSDADAGEAAFVAQTSAAGTYGTFTLDASGNWTYAADNAQAAIQALGSGEELTDSFTAVTADGTGQVVTVTITGVNDTAVIGGTTSGAVTEDAALSDGDLTASGALSVSDADAGEAEFEAQTSAAGTYGTFTLDASGNWIYAADNSQTAIQALGAGEELKDSFTAVSADGTTETVTVTITGVNDTAVIGGTTSGVVTEDAALSDGDLTASGALSVSDADAGEAEFEAQTSAAGTYGTFTLDASGNWIYAADNSQTAIQALGAGEELKDSFTAVSADGTTETVTVTITGVNDGAVIGGTTSGVVTEDAALTAGDLTASGTLSVSDADAGEAEFEAQTSAAVTYGTFTLDASGNWTYAADNSQTAIQALGAGEELEDSFTAATADGTGQVVTVTITGVNDTAVITGTTTGAVTEDADLSDGDLTASGTLSVSDADAGEAVFVAQASTAGTYGTFTLDASGNWTYAADNAQAAIQALGSGEELTDSFTAATADGTGQVVTVTITGVNDTAVITGTTTGAVTEDADLSDGDLTASGTLSVSDADAGEAVFVAQASTAGTYGTFTLDASGNWTYAADNAQSAIQALGADETLTDSFTAVTADGTTQLVTVTITGVNAGTGGVFELSEVSGNSDTSGFVINGVSSGDRAGFSVSSAGDVNGDGFDDLIVGAPGDDPNGSVSGASFVVFGKTDGTAVQLSNVEASSGGFVINGVSEFDNSGVSVSSAGDVNGDGFDDLIVGAYGDDPNGYSSGASFVVFGKTDGTAVELSAVEAGTGGFVINGVSAGDWSGRSVSSAGDVNGDGFDDLIVGASKDDPSGSSSGASFVVFGKTDGTAVELSAVEAGTGGFVINGVSAGDYSGYSVSSAGDVNGDGLDDLIVGARYDDPKGEASGASFVVFGKTNGTAVELSAVETGSGGFVINGVSEEDWSGFSVSSAGDVNGDGLHDLFVGARNDDPNGNSEAGAGFVVFGKTDGTKVELSDVEAGTGGFVINGASAEDESGWSVSAGDVNGDGLSDLIMGARAAGPNFYRSGASFVVFGKSDGTKVELSDVEAGTGGFVINGVSERDYSGTSVSSAGDVNGDGFDDLIVGAYRDDPNGTNSGASFVVFGGDFTGAATEIGTVGDDTLTGTSDRDILIGGTGNDTLEGTGGDDVLRGGAGDDVISIADLDFDRIDGSTGRDTLKLTGSGLTLDLDALDNTSLTSIEVIDLNGGGNALVISPVELFRLAEGTNTLRVLGASGNAVTLTGSTWSRGEDVSDGSVTYAVYTNGNATLEVAADIAVDGALPIAPVELSDVEAGSGGFVINGASEDDFSGWSVSSAGDVNGDGFDDLILGVPFDDPSGGLSGASFVVFGKSDGTAVELSDVDEGTGGFVINGVSAVDNSGRSVSAAGDVNDDGLDDLIVGAPWDDQNGNFSGTSFVVFGKSDGTAVELSDVETGTGGFVINGASEDDNSGWSVSSAGDVNGDGFDDLIVGAPLDDPHGGYSGASFLVFGKTDGAKVELSAVEAGTGGFAINGVSRNDQSGSSVSAAGDVNGDGFDDLIVGARFDDPNGSSSGASFVVFGKSDGTAVELSDAEAGTGGFVINGVSADDLSGHSVSSAGDVNDDGFDDLIVGAYQDDPNGSNSGATFVVFGKIDETAVELSDVEVGTGGFVINGVSAGDKSGYSVSSAGDVNGDGFADLIVGAPYDYPNANFHSGASFVVFGKNDSAAIELSDVEAGTGGFVINGVSAGDKSGYSVSSAGDVNGDGFDDLIVGAPFDDPNGSSSGASFVVFGGDFTGAATEVGTVGNDSLAGTSDRDVLIGGTGNDTLDGAGGTDVLRGGAGDDVISIADLSFDRIDGGNGRDTLKLTGTGLALDLDALDNTSLTSIEVIDLNGGGNALVISPVELFRLAEGTNTLRVLGASGDAVTLTGAIWNRGEDVTEGGATYAVYTNGNATLEVAADVTVDGANTAAEIGGTATGAVTEDAAETLTATGTLTVSDEDPGEAVFEAQASAAGTYGTFTLDASGNWTYAADNSQSAIQALGAGDEVTDSFTAVTADGTTQVVTVTITGASGAVVDGRLSGATVFRDTDGDRLLDDGELSSTTDSSGNFDPDAVEGSGALMSFGGVDISTGLPFIGTLTAPEGASVVTPLTTLVQGLVESGSGLTIAQAEALVREKLDLGDGDLLTEDPVALAESGSTGQLAAAAQVANIIALTEAAGGGGAEAAASLAQALAEYDAEGGSPAPLEDATAIQAAFESAGVAAEKTAALAGLAQSANQVLSENTGSGDSIATVQTVVSGTVAQAVSSGADLDGLDIADLTANTRPLRPTLDPVPSEIDAAMKTAGITFSGEGRSGTEIVIDFGGVIKTTPVADNAWSVTFDSSEFPADGALTVSVIGRTSVTVDGSTQSVDSSPRSASVSLDTTPPVGAAVIGGDTTGDVVEDTEASLTASGSLTVSDPDEGEAVFVVQTDTAGSNGYGVFQLGTEGGWSYAADNSQSAIQALGAGDELTDSFTAVTADGTEQVVTVTITGVNDAAVITGTTTGAVTEDADLSDGDLTASGTLAVSDTDAGEAVFVAQTSASGTYGTFTLDTSGNWTYAADNAQAAIQALGAGEELTDSFTAATADGTEQVLTVTITGVNDAAVIMGTTTGAVTEDAALTAGDLTASGTLSVSDADAGEAEFVAQTDTAGSNRYGLFQLGTDGAWSYAASNSQSAIQALGAGDELTDSFTAVSADGTTQVVTVTITGVNDAAVITGTTTGAVTEDADLSGADLTASGTLSVSDADADEAVFEAQTDTAGSNGHGLFQLGTDGSWSYAADNSQPAIQALDAGDELTDSFTAVSADGTTQAVTVTITGVNAGAGGVFELSEFSQSADGAGFVIKGASQFDYAGWSVSSAGDVNGDGLDDLIVGAPYDDPNGYESGASFVVFGKSDGTTVELTDVEGGMGGFVINGASQFDYAGWSVSSAGDVNGDGRDDLIVGAPGAGPNGGGSGASFVVFGKSDRTAVELSDVEAGTGGFVINGSSFDDLSGYSLSAAGDVNGDGFDDVIVGAWKDDPNGRDSGATFVVFGKSDGTKVELSTVEGGTGGFVINGVSAFDESGISVSTAGDVNGDGYDDLIVGAWGDSPNGNSDSGASFVVFGKTDGTGVELSDVEDGTGGFAISGAAANDRSGFAVSSAGDVNGDGLYDLIVGAVYDDPHGGNSGASFVVFGKSDGTTVELSDVEGGTGGFVINGVSVGDQSSRSVNSAGDVNGDGFDDLIVGAVYDDPNGSNSGASFVVFGKSDVAAVELSDVETGTGGFVINGVSAGDYSGFSVSSAGDVNGDGFQDLLLGAPLADTNGASSGASFVVFGGDFTGAATGIGTVGDDSLTGSSGGDVLIGGTGDDTLDGVGGADVLRGGAGDDVISIADLAFDRIDGGNGRDMLKLTGSGLTLDLDALDNASLTSIEVIDLNGGGNALTISPVELFRLAEGTNTLRVLGAGGDAVTLTGAIWNRGENVTDGGVTYAVYTNGNARLEVAADVTVDGANTAAEIGGTVTGAVTEDAAETLTATGTLTVSDEDPGESAFVAQTGAAGSNGYGVFQLGTDGSWSYAADNAQSTIQGLGAGEELTDSFTAVTADGTEQIVTVTITGVNAGAGGVFELSEVSQSADGAGFVINGVSVDDRSGISVSSAGDVNGDGFDDLIVGASHDGPNGAASGASFVVFGKSDGTTVELSDVEGGTGGFVINGVSEGDLSGRSVSSAGDVNGDGLDDLIVGALADDPSGSNSGASFVVFGKKDGVAVELTDVEGGTGGFVINGVIEEDYSGISVSSAGDVNGDGLNDLIVGAPFDDPHGNLAAGASFVVFGKSDGMKVDLSDVEVGTGGFVINGASRGDLSGWSVSSAGDVNGDGLDDLIVGAPYDDPNGYESGASFVVFGKTGGTAVKLSDVEAGTGGFAVNGVSKDDYAGFSVSLAGDVNGDGLADLVVGAPYDSPRDDKSGASFVIFGKRDGATVELSAVEAGVGGFAISGVAANDQSGRSVSSAGDVNGDGFDDLIVGAPLDDPNGGGSGASFVVFGKSDGTAVELSAVEAGTGGFVINGVSEGGYSGLSVSSAGDVNGDGFDDLIVGAYGDDPNGAFSGASFVVFGGDFTGAATEIGTVGDDSLTGSSGGDVLIGGTGDDTLDGVGGADVLRGGAGDDVISIADLTFDRVDGGNGRDTLKLTGSGLTLDLDAMDNTSLTSIEVIDLNGGGNALVISPVELFRLAEGTNTLRVLGASGDAVTLTGAIWNRGEDVTEGGATYAVYTNGNATLEVAADVTVDGANTAAEIGGTATGAVTEDAAETLTATGTLTVSDEDPGEAVFEAQTSAAGTYGTFTLDASGNWTYAADNSQSAIQALGADEEVTDSFTAVTADGTTQVVTVTIIGVNDMAVIGGTTTGAVTEDAALTEGDLTASGTLTVTDADTDEDVFVVQAGTEGSNGYGVFQLGTDGAWSYAADNSQSAIQALGAGETLTDSFMAVTADGTTQVVTVTITGVNEPIELSAVEAGSGGFVINGGSAYDYSGRSVSSAGDVNGDGFDDLIVGAPKDDPNGGWSGASFVVFGKSDGTAVDLSAVEGGTGGFVINGVSSGDFSGWSVSSAGDVNGDGFDDLIVGALADDPSGSNSGASFVVFGKKDGAGVELSTVEAGTGGFVINGVSASDRSGFSVSSAGDVNGDGFDDLIVGAPYDAPNGIDSGASFVVFGKADGAVVELSDVETGTGGFVINGVSADDRSGSSVSSAGDVNGDGFDDLIVGAHWDGHWDGPNGSFSGASFVVFGKSGGTAVELSAVEAGTGGFVINGVSAGDFSGSSVSSAGDVNGDGLGDLIVGAPNDDPNGYESGASYVVFGKADGSAVELSAVEAGTGGFVINGVSADDRSGSSVSSVGDVNGDGFDDLIVGAPGDDPNGDSSGASFVVFGKADGMAVELSDVEARTGGFAVNGVSVEDKSGSSVSSAGDVNGDGFDDLIVGAPFDDPNDNSNSGASFVVFGGDFTGSVTKIGTVADDSLTGTTANDIIFAGIGNDALISSGGTDRLSGGAGADTFMLRNLDGTTTILDFDSGEGLGAEGDVMDVSEFGLADFAAFQALLSPEGPGGHDTRIDLDGDTVVILQDVRPDDLVASNVLIGTA